LERRSVIPVNDSDTFAFLTLFKEACLKCFVQPLTNPLTETESKHLSNKILDQTGLVIGAKSIKNYSAFVLGIGNDKEENPSIATLDTLARYVSNAPYTDELSRKNSESHYPYWFQYKEQLHRTLPKTDKKKTIMRPILLAGGAAIIILAMIFLLRWRKNTAKLFEDDFHATSAESLKSQGWLVQSIDTAYWSRRGESPGYLSLFTLRGDNWPDSLNRPGIKNLLLREISSKCFVTEVYLRDFVPTQNWQQAGILLLEDTGFAGKSLRLSLAYNDFYGGFPKSREIIVQAIISNISKSNNADKPEEIVHQLIFKIDSPNQELVNQNLQHSAFRIEKNDTKFRLLFANGSMANSAFREIIIREIDIKPRFVGLFALKGFVDSAEQIPARFDFFRFTSKRCEQ
jgi:hypothetical protein